MVVQSRKSDSGHAMAKSHLYMLPEIHSNKNVGLAPRPIDHFWK
jgi:hypothetical protein